MTLTCPLCNQFIKTEVSFSSGKGTWALAGAILAIGGWLGFFIVPFFLKRTKELILKNEIQRLNYNSGKIVSSLKIVQGCGA